MLAPAALIPMSPDQVSSDAHEIPPLDSQSSVGSSPTLLNSETSDTRLSLGSSPTVKFAPFPQIDPARKRSLAPLGASARGRRKQVIQQEAGPLLWSTDPGLPEDSLEDPLITFAKFVKRTGVTLWRRVRKGSKAAIPMENVSYSGEPILDIRSRGEIMEQGGCLSRVEDKRGRRATWSPSDERRTLGLDETRRRKSDLSR